jgi:hypothetical protein
MTHQEIVAKLNRCLDEAVRYALPEEKNKPWPTCWVTVKSTWDAHANRTGILRPQHYLKYQPVQENDQFVILETHPNYRIWFAIDSIIDVTCC